MDNAHKAQSAIAWIIIGAVALGCIWLGACGPKWKDVQKPAQVKEAK